MAVAVRGRVSSPSRVCVNQAYETPPGRHHVRVHDCRVSHSRIPWGKGNPMA